MVERSPRMETVDLMKDTNADLLAMIGVGVLELDLGPSTESGTGEARYLRAR